MERRTFLGLGTGLLAGCGARPLVPSADTDTELRRLALRIEQRNRRTGERFREQRARLTPEELAKGRSEAVLAPFEDALVGMQAYASMAALPLEAQAHPEIQRVFLDGMERLGAGLQGLLGLFERLGPEGLGQLQLQLEEQPELLEASARFVRGELLVGLPSPAREQLEQSVDRLRFRMKRGGTGQLLSEFQRDMKRLQRTAERGDWSALEPTDPEQKQRIERAAQGWDAATDAQEAGARTGAGVALILLGLLSIGAGAALGIALVAAGVEAIACLCVGIPLILFGLLVLGIGVVGGVACFMWAANLMDPEKMLGDPEALVLELSDPSWRASGMRAGAGIQVTIRAKGEATINGQTCGPEGHPSRTAPPGAPAPGLPYGAVVARVNLGQPFVVAGEVQTPLGELGPIDVALNALPTEGDVGRFVVRVG